MLSYCHVGHVVVLSCCRVVMLVRCCVILGLSVSVLVAVLVSVLVSIPMKILPINRRQRKTSRPTRPLQQHKEHAVETYLVVLSRWGGGGKEYMVKTAAAAVEKRAVGSEQATSKADPCVLSLLNVLYFSTPVLRMLWDIIQLQPVVVSDLHIMLDVKKR